MPVKSAMPEGPSAPDAISKGAAAVDPKGWVRSFDEQGEFIQSEILVMINAITDNSPGASADSRLLTPLQAFQLMRMFRLASAVTANGVKWRIIGQTLELTAAICSAAVPVLVGLQTQFGKDDQPVLYWIINLLSISLSLIATICVAMERVRGFKEQGVIERMEGMDGLLQLKRFISGCAPYDGDYRANFPALTLQFTEIQHKGTSDLYYAFKSSDGNTSKEGVAEPKAKVEDAHPPGGGAAASTSQFMGEQGFQAPAALQEMQGHIQATHQKIDQFQVKMARAGEEITKENPED